MNDLGIIITAYKQKNLVEDNIVRIRKRYKILDTIPIVIVSTSENDIGFDQLTNQYNDIHFIDFSNAPGSSSCIGWESRKNNGGYIHWRHEFLPPRILLSMQKGIQYSYDIGIKKVIHFHSDTFFREDLENNLVRDFDRLSECLMIADTSSEDEGAAEEGKIVPKMLHIHPEGLMLNLDRCYEIGYGFEFYKIFGNYGFESHNFGSIEALLGQFCIWCLTKQNIIKFDDIIPDEYFKNVYFRMNRGYHGDFEGLVNLKGQQEDGR